MKGGRTPLHLWGRWCPADYLADETVRLCAARGNVAALAVYFHVLQASRVGGGDLPADIEGLAAVLGMPRKLVARGLAPWVEGGKLKVEAGRLFHPRVRREVEHDLAFREAAAISGTAGGQRSALKRPKGTVEGTLKGTVEAPSTYPEPEPVPEPDPVPEPPPEPERTTTENGLPAAPQPAPSLAIAKPRKESWSRDACDDWTARFGGTAPGGQIGKAMKPLVDHHGWPAVRPAWRAYLAQTEAAFASAARFASTFGAWSGTAAPARSARLTVGEKNMEVLRRCEERRTGGTEEP